MSNFLAPYPRYSRHADGSDGLHLAHQVHFGPGNQQVVASDLEALFQQRLQKLANPSSWQQIQEGDIPGNQGLEASSSFHQAMQDPRENPGHFQNLEYGGPLSYFQAQDILSAHSAQIGTGPRHSLVNLPAFGTRLSTSHDYPMDSISSGRSDEQAHPPSRILENYCEAAQPEADPCKGPQVIFTVEEHPYDEDTLDGPSPARPTPEVTVMREAPEWAPLSALAGARVEKRLDMKPADKKLLKWVFGSDYPPHWD